VKTGPLARPSRSSQPKADTQPAPEWLKDVSVAAQHLTSLSLESSSQASLITNGDQIWAYAGELPQNAVEELTQIVSGYFADGSNSDLARFISLAATSSEYMLYATWLGGGYVLAMVFDAEMPFSKIRSQASSLAQALSSPPGSSRDEAALSDEPSFDYPDNEPSRPLQPLLDDVPPPIPNDWIPESMVSAERKGFLDELLEDDLSPSLPKTEELNLEPNVVPQVEVALDVGEVDHMAETMVSKVDQDQVIAETIQSRSTRDGKIGKLEPVSPSLYNLTYACVLIPRFKHHHLTGAIATRLSDWISNMSVAFGWRLEHLAIRPEYIQWLVNVPPNTSPGYLMRTIRQHTSRRMFVEFPLLEEENPSGDFWAPGYLVMSGDQPPPAQLIKNFIQNTRKRQGILK
jgi:REP element-mobilizing transposase RayT